jgi:tetratricopeptide (TPR) repeat protein
MGKRFIAALALTIVTAYAAYAQAPQPANDIALVLPFENTSDKSEFNWVGESFANSLTDLLKIPGYNVVSNEERKILQQKLRIPLNNIPSIGTSLRMAREVNATHLILGSYNFEPVGNDQVVKILVKSRIVRVAEGRLVGDMIEGRLNPLELVVHDALGNLQTIQGQLAYEILLRRDRSLSYSKNEIIGNANKVPGKAFEAYIKGLLTLEPQAKENYFKNATRLFGEYKKREAEDPKNLIAEGTVNLTYSEAELELGHLYLGQRKFSDAIGAFEKVVSAAQKCREKAKVENKPAQCSDENYAEASFYIGLIFWQQGNYEPALATLRPLTEDLKLTTVYNALGAIAVQASRAEKKNPARAAALLNEGMVLLKKASDSAPDDANVRFNYATTLFLNGNIPDAARELRSSIVANPRDGEAYFVLSKALDSLKDPTLPDITNQAQRFLTENNRYAKLETEWQKSKSFPDIPLRVNQPARKDFVAVVLSRKPATTIAPQVSETETLLATARTLIKNGSDDEAMTTLRRVLASEPMSAESYLLLGKIHLRRGDIDQAISSFKTSVFWDNKLVDAHVSLGKIYVERGDCLQAKSYVASATEINAENADVIALQRLSERCSK